MKARMLALVFLVALAAAACGEETTAPTGDDGDDVAGDATETEEPAGDETDAGEDMEEPTDDGTETEAAAGDDGGTVVAVTGTEHGDVLVDREGRTLYMFDNDGGGAPTCYDDCASNWPPLLSEGGVSAGEGADESLLGEVERDDGTTQVTYASHPLYYFSGDGAAGDVAGQGVGDVWWVLSADGEPVREEESASRYDY